MRRGKARTTNGYDVTNGESVRSTRESTVRDARDVHSQTGTHNERGRLEHLWHSGSPFRSEVTENDHSLLLDRDFLRGNGLGDVVLVVKDSCFTLERESLLSGDLRNTSASREVSSENTAGGKSESESRQQDRGSRENSPNMTGRLDRVAEGSDNVLAMRKVLRLLEVLAERLSSHSHDISIDELVLVKVFEDR